MSKFAEVANGFAFTEGPCVDRRGRLHVVELANRCVSRIENGKRVEFVQLGGSPNGAAFGPDGDLYVANGGGNWGPNASTGGRAGWGGAGSYIQRVRADGWSRVVLAAIDGQPLHSPNDLCFDAEGGLYFTDPVWPPRKPDGLADASRVSAGDICFLGADGSARRCHTGLLFPNGIAVSPQGDAVLVDETGTGIVHRFPILSPGVLGKPEVYVELGPASGPDGMCFDSTGRLLVAGHGSHQVFVVAPGGGKVEGSLRFDDAEVTNVCFGGDDLKTLFVTLAATGRVVSVDWDVPGLAPHAGF
ncbi:MAG: SMP-30/gluconolactonase/LRE family protein [Burkholderiaceae bacterium]